MSKAKINAQIREQIIADYKTKQYSYASLAAKYGTSPTSIGRIVNTEYYEREKEKNRIRGRSYKQSKPKFTLNVKFYEKDQPLIDKVNTVDNKQQYIKDLISKDMESDSDKDE